MVGLDKTGENFGKREIGKLIQSWVQKNYFSSKIV